MAVTGPTAVSPTSGIAAARRSALVISTAVISLIASTTAVMLAPLLPLLQTEYGVGTSSIAWALTAGSLVGAAALVVMPRLADVIGDRWTVVLAGLTMVLGAAISAAGNSFITLLIGAALLGWGSVASLLGLALLRRHLPGSSLQIAITVVTLAQGAGLGVGFVLGGFAVEHVTLTTFFWLVAAASLVSTVAVWLAVPNDRGEGSGKVGVVGALTMIVWLVALLLALAQSPVWGLADPRTVGLLVIGIVGAVIWVRYQRVAATPVFDLELLALPVVWRACLSGGLVAAALYLLLVLAPTYMQMPPDVGYGLGLSPLESGILLLPEAIAVLISGAVAGMLVTRGAALRTAAIGSALVAASFLWLAFAHDEGWHYLVGSGLFGLGFGAVTAAVFGAVQTAVEAQRAGMATGMVGTALAIGSGAGAPLAAAILTAEEVEGIPGLPTEILYTYGYLAAAGLAITAILVAVVPGTRRRATASPKPQHA